MADYLTGLILQVKGSDVAAADGGLISTITPSVGPTVTQSQSGVQPTYIEANANLQYRPSIRVAAGKGFVTSLADSTGSYSLVFAVYVNPSYPQFWFDAGTSSRWLVGSSSSNQNWSAYDGSFQISPTTMTSGAHILVWTLDAVNDQTFIYVDGSRVDGGSLGWVSRAIATPVAVFSNNDGPTNPAGSLIGDVGEFRLYAGVLTPSQVAGVTAALTAQYISTPANLLICLGNSITYGYNALTGGQISDPYPLQAEQQLGPAWRVFNQGFSGNSMDLIMDFNPYPTGSGDGIGSGTWETNGGIGTSPYSSVVALASGSWSRIVFVLGEGINSIIASNAAYGPNAYLTYLPSATGQTVQDVFNRFVAAALKIKASVSGAEVWVCTSIAGNAPPSGQAANFMVEINALNVLLRGGNAAFNGVIDWQNANGASVFATLAQTSNSTYYNTDGIHPLNPGAAVLADAVYNAVTQVAAATSFTLTGPSTGAVGTPSSNFTVTPNGPYTGTITPSDSGAGGTFTPSSLTFTASASAQTFTYTAATGGAKTISASASPTLTAPSSLTYTPNPPPTDIPTISYAYNSGGIVVTPLAATVSGETVILTLNGTPVTLSGGSYTYAGTLGSSPLPQFAAYYTNSYGSGPSVRSVPFTGGGSLSMSLSLSL